VIHHLTSAVLHWVSSQRVWGCFSGWWSCGRCQREKGPGVD